MSIPSFLSNDAYISIDVETSGPIPSQYAMQSIGACSIEDCCNPTSPITHEQMLSPTDQLIISVISALEGDQEIEIVRMLLRMRDALKDQHTNQALNADAEAVRAEVINIVNNFFYEKLTAVPEIKVYMDGFQH